ncbi:hypothetical protein KYB31_12290 [Clostridium felsineum]|uniref:hypothetical protein n=1 Tax=Clostridium felsineum TaxID=36839 RepID=UPI00214D96A8|nr:hypothetical protein [Clostridium felsineum]MCR3759755.1 hypothetical protein [Clostridium felsineum]
MVNKLYEIEIVKTFFNKHCRERIIYELNSKKKRMNAISRLCHDFKEVLKIDYMKEINCVDYKEVLEQIKKYSGANACYVISYNKEVDGLYMELDDALKSIVGLGMPSLVVCNMQNKLAYFEAEQVNGAPPRYILEMS